MRTNTKNKRKKNIQVLHFFVLVMLPTSAWRCRSKCPFPLFL